MSVTGETPHPDAIFTLLRLAFVAAFTVYFAWLRRLPRKRLFSRVALWGPFVFVALAWLASSYALPRLYGLQLPGDRLRNLSWAMSVAAGGSPFETGIIAPGQRSLEPVWSFLVGTLGFHDPAIVLAIYPYLSLAVLVLLAFSLHFHFTRTSSDGDQSARPLFIVAFCLLCATAPLDFVGPYRSYWSKMFLLKPNHALGLVLLPWIVTLLGGDTKKHVVGAGLVLGLLGWVFILHWAFVGVGLIVYLVLVVVLERPGLNRELGRIVAVGALSVVIVFPWFRMLATSFPTAVTLEAGSYEEDATRSHWGDQLPVSRSLFFLVTFDQGAVFYLGVVGLWWWLRYRSRTRLVWAALLIGSYFLFFANYLLYLTARAREADEFYYFLIFMLSIAAGEGAFRVFCFLASLAERSDSGRRPLAWERSGAALLLLAPLASAYWWQPSIMDSHYRLALKHLPEDVVSLTSWVRRETDTRAVFIADGDGAHWIPALSGRRSLVPYGEGLATVSEILAQGCEPGALASSPYKDAYLLWDLTLAGHLKLERIFPETRDCFEPVFDDGRFRVFRIDAPP